MFCQKCKLQESHVKSEAVDYLPCAGGEDTIATVVLQSSSVSRLGLAVRCLAGKWKDLGLIPLQLSFLFKKVVVCGHCLVTLSITSY